MTWAKGPLQNMRGQPVTLTVVLMEVGEEAGGGGGITNTDPSPSIPTMLKLVPTFANKSSACAQTPRRPNSPSSQCFSEFSRKEKSYHQVFERGGGGGGEGGRGGGGGGRKRWRTVCDWLMPDASSDISKTFTFYSGHRINCAWTVE